jgi:putative glycosyltransferase (TIGR04372 family)
MSEGSFGHTITAPDVARRLFQGKRCALIAFSEYHAHNWQVRHIWPDIFLFFVPISWGITLAGRSYRLGFSHSLKTWLLRFVEKAVQFMNPGFPQVITMKDLYSRVRLLKPLKCPPDNFSYAWPIGYFQLQQDVSAPCLRLPLPIRERIRSKLAELAKRDDVKLCGLYLRRKGEDSSDHTTNWRVGSPLSEYLPAVEALNDAGYQVILVGDGVLDSTTSKRFSGMLVDARSVSVDKDLLDLFGATEVDIFIGETGGGLWLPGINHIPLLHLNAYPYFVAKPNSWIYYKTVTDRDGNLVHYREIFANHMYDYELPGMTLHDNSSEEIRKAVTCFLDCLSTGTPQTWDEELLAELPENAWIRHASNARISPAFLDLFKNQHYLPSRTQLQKKAS